MSTKKNKSGAESQGLRTDYRYDVLHRRVASYESSTSTTTLFVMDGWNVINERQSNLKFGATNLSSPTARHTWGEDVSGTLQGAGGVGGLLSSFHQLRSIKNKDRGHEDLALCFHYDSNGNIILLSDTTARESARYTYDAFGQTINATGSAAALNKYRFSTKPIETCSGLVYYGFRYYNRECGSWISRDVIGEFGGINLFGFVLNAPTGLIDVIGRNPVPGSTGTEVPGTADPSFDCGGYAVDIQSPISSDSIENSPTTSGVDCDTEFPCQCGYHRIAKYVSEGWFSDINESIHYYRDNGDGTWSCKYGTGSVYNNITDPTDDYNSVYVPEFTSIIFGAPPVRRECFCVPDL